MSPSRALMSALAIGEIQDTTPRAGSTSSTPTMVTVRSPAAELHAHRGAEEDLVGVAPGAVHHLRVLEPLDEEAHAPVDLAQALLAVDVVAVLGAVAVRRRPRDGLHHLGTLDLD